MAAKKKSKKSAAGNKARKTRRSKKPRIIDAHNHVKWYGHGARKLVENMDENGIDKTWLLTWEVPLEEIQSAYFAAVNHPNHVGLPIEDVIEAVEKYPDRLIPFYAPDPREELSVKKLEGAVKYFGVRGFGELKVRIMLDDPRALEIFHFCGENGLPVIFHMDVPLPRRHYDKSPGYWYCCDWDNLAKALVECPKTNFIGHAPGFWREISGDADQVTEAYPKGQIKPFGKLWIYLDKYPNLYCDLSASSALTAISRDKNKGREFLLRYQDRCLFGRDCFDNRLHAYLKSLKLPRGTLNKILRDNALKLVPLD